MPTINEITLDFNRFLQQVRSEHLPENDFNLMIAGFWQTSETARTAMVDDYVNNGVVPIIDPLNPDIKDCTRFIAQLQEIGINHTKTTDLYIKMMNKFHHEIDKHAFVDSIAERDTYKPSIKTPDYAPLELKTFIGRSKSDYDSGYGYTTISMINREKARQSAGNIAFLDGFTIAQSNSSVVDDQLTGVTARNLLTGATPIKVGDNNPSVLGRFLEQLKINDNIKKFDTVVIPVGCQGEEDVGHAVTLVIEPNSTPMKAKIIDQLGDQTHYPESKKLISHILFKSLGIKNNDIEYNPHPLTKKNYNDCACVASLVADGIFNGTDYIGLPDPAASGYKYSKSDVENNHQQDQNLARQALYNMYLNSPIFQTYLDVQGINFNTLDDQGKERIVTGFNLFKDRQYEPDGNPENAPDDEAWKAQARPYIETHINTPSRRFTEEVDPNYPHCLVYKHADGSTMRFIDTHSCNIQSNNLEDHMALCQLALDTGHKNINFGPYFHDHPEEAAKLYLAALKTGINPKNAPALDNFTNLPEFKEIKKLDFNRRLKEAQKTIITAQSKCDNDPAYQALKQDLQNARQAFFNSDPAGTPPGHSIKSEWQSINQIDLQLETETDPLIRAILVTQKKQHKLNMTTFRNEPHYAAFNSAYDNAKSALDNSPLYLDLKEARSQQEFLMKDAVEFYLSEGNENMLPAERMQKLQQLQAGLAIKYEDRTNPANNESEAAFDSRKAALASGTYVDDATINASTTLRDKDQFKAKQQEYKERVLNNTQGPLSPQGSQQAIVNNYVRQLIKGGKTPF